MLAALVVPCLATLQDYAAIDAKRGRLVAAKLLAPSEQSDAAGGLVAFAHGFGLTASDYTWLATGLAAHGYAVVLPTAAGAPKTTDLALDQRFLLAHLVEQAASNASSPVYGRIVNKTAIAGHSLGGGSTLLGADPSLGAGYAEPTALFTTSLGTYTIPPALASVPAIPASLPALLFTATQDCIDPPANNSLPVFAALRTGCKRVVSLVGGAHCEYADASLRTAGCRATETLCGAHPNISQATQAARTLAVLVPYLDAALGLNKGTWAAYERAVADGVAAGELLVLAEGACERPGAAADPAATSAADAEFAAACQEVLATPALADRLSIRVIDADKSTFGGTKPHISPSADHSRANLTALVTAESTAPFNKSVAIKLKSREAIREALNASSALVRVGEDAPSCAAFHALSLRQALASMSDTAARDAYERNETTQLRFSPDQAWHTGIWVALAKIGVESRESALWLTSPRFNASTSVPGDFGGVFYCRLVPPQAFSQWIVANYHRSVRAA